MVVGGTTTAQLTSFLRDDGDGGDVVPPPGPPGLNQSWNNSPAWHPNQKLEEDDGGGDLLTLQWTSSTESSAAGDHHAAAVVDGLASQLHDQLMAAGPSSSSSSSSSRALRNVRDLSPYLLTDRDLPSRSIVLFGLQRVPADVVYEISRSVGSVTSFSHEFLATRGVVFVEFSDVRRAAFARRHVVDELRRLVPNLLDDGVDARSIAHVPCSTDTEKMILLCSRTIVISGMPPESAEPDLRNVFARNMYGDIQEVRRESSGTSAAATFAVTFFDRADAERAVKELAPAKKYRGEGANAPVPAPAGGLQVIIQPPSDDTIATLRALSLQVDSWRREQSAAAAAPAASSPTRLGNVDTTPEGFVSMLASFTSARQSQSSIVGSECPSGLSNAQSPRASFASDHFSLRTSHFLDHQHQHPRPSSFSDFRGAAAGGGVVAGGGGGDASSQQHQQQLQQQQRGFSFPEQSFHRQQRSGSFSTGHSRNRDVVDLRTIDEERRHYGPSSRSHDRATFSDAEHLDSFASTANAPGLCFPNSRSYSSSSGNFLATAEEEEEQGKNSFHPSDSSSLRHFSRSGSFGDEDSSSMRGSFRNVVANSSPWSSTEGRGSALEDPWATLGRESSSSLSSMISAAPREDKAPSGSFDDFRQQSRTSQRVSPSQPHVLGPIQGQQQRRDAVPRPGSPNSARRNSRGNRRGTEGSLNHRAGGLPGSGGTPASSQQQAQVPYSPAATGNSNPADFAFDFDRVSTGMDQRTTLMVRNIPNKYTQQAVLDEINIKFPKAYDFFYLPIDFKNKCNVGYAFINLIDFRNAPAFYQEFNGRRWSCYRSGKVCAITYARIQGRQSMITRFQNSSLLNESIDVQPRLFRTSGPHKGEPEPFPGANPPTTSSTSYPELGGSTTQNSTTSGVVVVLPNSGASSATTAPANAVSIRNGASSKHTKQSAHVVSRASSI